MINELLPHN